MHKRALGFGFAAGFLAICTVARAAENRPCTPTEAMAATAAQEFEAQSRFAEATIASLQKMSAINAKATNPNKPIKDQLSPADIRTFNDARAEMIRIGMVQSAVSRNTRNMRLLEGGAQYAEIMDVDQFDTSTVPKTDPRAFYFTLIGALREAQPSPPETTLPDPRNGCTMEAALSLVEHFNMQQMASQPTNRGMLELILDIRRLEQFLSIMRKADELDQRDARNIHVDAIGNPVNLDDSFTKWLQTQPASSQKMGTVILRAVDATLPSKSNYDINRQAAQAAEINAEYQRH